MTNIWHNETLTLDERLALKTAAGHPAREIDGTFGDRPSNGSCILLRRVRRARHRARTSCHC